MQVKTHFKVLRFPMSSTLMRCSKGIIYPSCDAGFSINDDWFLEQKLWIWLFEGFPVAQDLHNNRIKFPKDFFSIVLSTNMAAVTSGAIKESSTTVGTCMGSVQSLLCNVNIDHFHIPQWGTAYSQEHLKTMVYVKLAVGEGGLGGGGQTKCIMGNVEMDRPFYSSVLSYQAFE